MADRVTAQIIPFPCQAAPVPERLSNALTSLAQAMADQRAAVAAWRNAAKDLATQMQTLSNTLSASKLTLAKRN